MFQIFDSLPSTNDYCLDYAKTHPGEKLVCIAHQQTQGRGRQGKTWDSSQAENLYLSYLRPVSCQAPLALVVGIVLAQLLTDIGVQAVGLKWPNDVWVDGAKIAGILIEGPVIGIGLNIAPPVGVNDQNVTSLSEQGIGCDKLALARSLIMALEAAIVQLENTGFEGFLADWAGFDILAGRDVAWENGRVSGQSKALGINKDGGLILADEPFVLYAGSVWVLPNLS
jgi:BirA family biotin operon repressor/biotin-[acetyl-CoA-carboxylase] ligase